MAGLSGLSLVSYRERLEKLNLTTLLERRMRGDLIETYKILNNFTNYEQGWFLQSERTRNLVIIAMSTMSHVAIDRHLGHRGHCNFADR